MKTRFFSLSVLIALIGTVSAQEWTRFRGPGGAGLTDTKGIPTDLSGDAIQWAVELGGTGHSSPVLWGDTVFLTMTSPESDNRQVVALEGGTGKIKWRVDHPLNKYKQHKFNDYASATPCCDAENVYVSWTSPEGVDVFAISHAGKPVWSKRIGKFYAKHGSSASPVLAGGLVVVGSFGETGDSFIAGLDPKTGDERWRLKRESNDKGSYVTPLLRKADDGKEELIFASTAHGLTAVNPADGKIRWEHDAGFSQRCVGGPVISGNTIFLAAGSGGGGKQSTVIEVKGGMPKVAWEAGLKGLPYVPTGLAKDGLFYLLNDGGLMTCRREKDGEVLWQERVVDAPYASPICIGEHIYCFSKKGDAAVLKLGETYQPVAQSKFDEGIYATPAIANGKMYLRTFTKLYCIGGK